MPDAIGNAQCTPESFMTNIQQKMMPTRSRVMAIALSVVLSWIGTSCATQRPVQDRNVSGTSYSSKRMPDGKLWTTENLNLDTAESYCYGDVELNCRRHGRLYTWESAQRGCRSLGDGWRLPTNDDWRQLAKHHGGIRDDSGDGGKAVYQALLIGGTSGFNALLGGGRAIGDGQYARLEAMASTGPHRNVIQPLHGSTTLVRAGCISIVIPMARSRGRFQCGASGSNVHASESEERTS